MDDEATEHPADDEVEGPADQAAGGPDTARIAPVVQAAMRDRMHAHRQFPPDAPEHVDDVVGEGDDVVFAIDDGPEHCMVGRAVGQGDDGVIYVLVGRVTLFGYEQLRAGAVDAVGALSEAHDVSLCAVYALDGTIENIALVTHYRGADRVPDEYLPGRPFLEFTEDTAPGD
ncbi:MAG: hypothetical protein ACRDY1_03710 [Acidimicrobiales bacterium]